METQKRLLSTQNKKLGRISSFSLPLTSCYKEQSKHCSKYCYAKKMYRLYPAYREKMNYNYKVAKSDDFVERMCYELKEASMFVRIHVSGDFFSQEYLEKWYEIARRNPRHIFYCYTKAIFLDFWGRPNNLIIYLSDDRRVLDKHHNRFDGVATISFDKEPIEGFTLCRHQVDGTNCAHCGMCMEKNKRIYFNKH